MSTGFQSIDAPPERHADRAIADMLPVLTKKRAQVGPEVVPAPRANGRACQAGAVHVPVETGTRGRYEMVIPELVGWNPDTDSEIGGGDPIPEAAYMIWRALAGSSPPGDN